MSPLARYSNPRLALRFAFVALLTLALLVPLLFVSGVAHERQGYYRQVVHEVGQSWGRSQSIVGPFIVVPAQDRASFVDDNGKVRHRSVQSAHYILPTELDVEVDLQHEFRERGIYSVPVYTSVVKLKGNLGLIDKKAIEAEHEKVFWSAAKVVIGIQDPRAIRRADAMFNQDSVKLLPGTTIDGLPQGVHLDIDQLHGLLAEPERPIAAGDAPSTGAAGTPSAFSVTLHLGGTEAFALAPIGDQTNINMHSSWPHPSFQGDFLPATRDITPAGFDASWQVSALARGMPRVFSGNPDRISFNQLLAGVNIHEPITVYTTIDRGIKYGLLFVALTFLSALCFELLSGQRFHLIQYAVVGLALVLFYLTVLSVSEHIRFGLAYAVATGLIVGLLGWYAYSITQSTRVGLLFAGIEVGLYWVLYVLLQLEDLALLAGTGVLLVGLAILMFATRTLHRLGDQGPSSEPPSAPGPVSSNSSPLSSPPGAPVMA